MIPVRTYLVTFPMTLSRPWFPIRERWFLWPLLLHLSVWLLLGHVYETLVFQDASRRLAMGQGVYENFSAWVGGHGDGYFAYPPLYAYLLWASGELAELLGGHWWVSQLLMKAWMLIADLLTVTMLYRISPHAAKRYWTLWYLPIVAIGLVQPDLWVGLSVLLAFYLAQNGRWMGTGFALAAAAGMKMAPIVILPFLFLHLAQTQRWMAAWKVAAGVAVGLVLVWLPYSIAFDDAGKFKEVLLFHFSRPVAGLNPLAGLQMLMGGGFTIAMLAGLDVPSGHPLSEAVHGAAAYPMFTLLVFTALAFVARAQRWPLDRVFCLPLLAFLLSNKVVLEHYVLYVLPLLLIAFPGAWPRLSASYAVYLIAAGTPWRFFPTQYGLPSTLDALIPAPLHALLGPALMVSFAIVAGGAALSFSWQLCKLLLRLCRAAPLGPSVAPLSLLLGHPSRVPAVPEPDRP